MANRLALNVECQGHCRRIAVERKYMTVFDFKKVVGDEFRISDTFDLIYDGAVLSENSSLVDLCIDPKCEIRVRIKSNKRSPEIISKIDKNDDASKFDVFLSYEWNHQKEVILLKSHLERYNYTCWLDVEQMRGGDSLYSSIDQGIRKARVFICCINSKYPDSDNCRRELNLATNLKKPIVPLLMEKIPLWPPERIGPLLSEYLYIRFYTSSASRDTVPWSDAKFNELLDTLTYILSQLH